MVDLGHKEEMNRGIGALKYSQLWHESMFFSFRIHVPYVENRITHNIAISNTKKNLTEIVFYQYEIILFFIFNFNV